MKRIIALVSAVGLLLGLVGCGGNKPVAPAVSPTILWMNGTYAVLTEINQWDYTLVGGAPANEQSKAIQLQALKDWWSVTDRKSAEDTLAWAINEGHRADYVEEMADLEDAGASELTEDELAMLLADYFDSLEASKTFAQNYTYYVNNPENNISAWDYSRAMSLLGWYYLAGYYTEAEALDQSLELAKVIQERFSSWDDFMESYMVGYEYWSESDSTERRAVYEGLKAKADSPFQLDWNTPLEKTW